MAKQDSTRLEHDKEPQIKLEAVIIDLLDGLRRASSLTEANVAAGLAWQELQGAA